MQIRRIFILVAGIFALYLNGISAVADELPSGRGYLLQPEDVLEISVWKEEDLQSQVVVRPDGKLSFPLVGHIQAAGRTPEELEAEVVKRLNQYVPDSVVTVSVIQVKGNKVYVIGKVARPGEYPAGSYIDVMQALSKAGGPTPFAAVNDIKILRRNKEGKESAIPFRYSDIESGKNLEQNVLLESGDVVVVP